MTRPVSSGIEKAGANAPIFKGESPTPVDDLITRLGALLGDGVLMDRELFLATVRALDFFFVKSEEPFDVAFADFFESFGLAFVDELFSGVRDLPLDGIQPPLENDDRVTRM